MSFWLGPCCLYLLLTSLGLGFLACPKKKVEEPYILALNAILGSVVKEVVGNAIPIKILVPNGVDVHDWEASAKDIEMLNKADFIVANGLGLEHNLEKSMTLVPSGKEGIFIAGNHISPLTGIDRFADLEKGKDGAASHEKEGLAFDPHFWTDPQLMASVVKDLVPILEKKFSVDLSKGKALFEKKIGDLDAGIKKEFSSLKNRNIVTSHESLGYFAHRYGLVVRGAIIPSLSTDAEKTAADLANLSQIINRYKVKCLFIDGGISKKEAESLAVQFNVRLLPLDPERLLPDENYFSFIRRLADTIAQGLG